MNFKTPQEWYIESLSTILKNRKDYIGDFGKDEAYKYVLKGFCDKYSNTFVWKELRKFRKSSNSIILNMYWESFIPNHYDIILNTIICSKEAYEFLTLKINAITDVKKAQNEIKKELHLEHLTPMSYSRTKLLQLKNPSFDNVKSCFKYAVVSLISKDESVKLDSGGRVEQKDIEMLEDLKKQYNTIISDDEIKEAKSLYKEKKALKNSGNGLIRLIHLFNEGVKFVDSRGNVINHFDALFTMLVNNTFIVEQYKK